MINDSGNQLFLKRSAYLCRALPKQESREESRVCLLVERPLIYFRMQCLWSVVQRCVCSTKRILFIWVCASVRPGRSHMPDAPLHVFGSVLLSVLFLWCLCTLPVCVCVWNVILQGWRQDWTAVAAWLSCEAGWRCDGQYGDGMFAGGAYVRTHTLTQALRQRTGGWLALF